MEFDVEKMSKALAECHGGRCFDGCYLFDTAIKDEQMRCMNCLNIANEVIKKLTEQNARLQTDYNELYELTTEELKEKSEQIFKLENRLKECENGYEGTLFLESCKRHDAEEKVKELTAENERLRERLDREAKCQYDLCGQIVDLKEENKVRKGLNTMLTNELKRCKADTVQKVRSLIEGRAAMCGKMSNGMITNRVYHLTEDFLDQIEKELLEEI